MHIYIRHGRHLGLLDRAHTSLGMEYEYGDIRFSPQSINSCAPGIATGRTYDGQLLSLFTRRLCFVATLEEVREKVAKELERDVLEGICRAMEELEDILGARLVSCEWLERSDIGMAPSGGVVSGMDKGGKVCGGNLIWGDEEREDLDAKLGESFVCPGLLPASG